MPKIQLGSGGSLYCTLPAQVCKVKGWGKGDELAILLDSRSGDIVVRKVGLYAKAIQASTRCDP